MAPGWFTCFGEPPVAPVAVAAKTVDEKPKPVGPAPVAASVKLQSYQPPTRVDEGSSIVVTEVQPFNVDDDKATEVRSNRSSSLDDQASSMMERSSSTPVKSNLHPNATPIPQDLFNGSRKGAYGMFNRYDLDKDGFLLKQDLSHIFKDLRLDITPELFNQLLDCNFVYADRDHDNMLAFEEFLILYKMISDTNTKFLLHDVDGDGMITKTEFACVVKELNLHLEPEMLQHYVDINFRFADRAMRGVISVGQFLACYANFLYSHAVTTGTKGTQSHAHTNSGNGHTAAKHMSSAPREMPAGRVGDVEVEDFS